MEVVGPGRQQQRVVSQSSGDGICPAAPGQLGVDPLIVQLAPEKLLQRVCALELVK
jgi:hypothetical protein